MTAAARRLGRAGAAVASLAALAAGITAPGAAAATTTETAAHAGVSATFTYSGSVPNFGGLHLTIARAGTVVYDAAVSSRWCDSFCWPGAFGRSSIHVVSLSGSAVPEVVLDLYTGGAHCCTVEEIFTLDATGAYVKSEQWFGDAGASLEDLSHDGRHEFVSADDAFAGAFTSFAASGLPIEIVAFRAGRFFDVTRSYPVLIRRDARRWWRVYRAHPTDGAGVIAAWAADEYLLGRRAAASARMTLATERRRGHISAAFVGDLLTLLRHRGYDH